MSAKEDLQKKIQSLEDQLEKAQDSLHKILIAEFPFQPGAKVKSQYHRQQTFTVSSVRIRYGEPRAYGKKTLKNGQLGNQEFELYGNLEAQ